jgi:hypothetical protein
MFSTLADPGTRARVEEMVRVRKPDAFLIVTDWRIRKLRSPQDGVRACGDVRQQLTRLDPDTDLVTVERGALVPPPGRVFSTWSPSRLHTWFASAHE